MIIHIYQINESVIRLAMPINPLLPPPVHYWHCSLMETANDCKKNI